MTRGRSGSIRGPHTVVRRNSQNGVRDDRDEMIGARRRRDQIDEPSERGHETEQIISSANVWCGSKAAVS